MRTLRSDRGRFSRAPKFGRFAVVVAVVGVVTAAAAGPAAASVATNTYVLSTNTTADESLSTPCPTGARTVAGGEDAPDGATGVKIPINEPLGDSVDLLSMPGGSGTGTTFVPTRWGSYLRNQTAGAARVLKNAVICATGTGSLGPVIVSVAVASVPAFQRGTATATCPASNPTVLGGGFAGLGLNVETSQPLMSGQPLDAFGDGVVPAAPTAWAVTAANPTGNAIRIGVGALCADQTGFGPPTTIVSSSSIGPNAAAQTMTNCPAGTEAVGGGIENPVGSVVTSDGPSAGGRLGGLNDGPAGSATGWFVAGSNTADTPGTIRGVAICSPTMKKVFRIGGTDRIDTANQVSRTQVPVNLTASAVVLARSDPGQFADALVAAPLAVAKGGPLLLTTTAALDPRTQAEIQRVLPKGKTVYLMGGTAALSSDVASTLTSLGYVVVRYGGATRFETATTVATDGLGSPTTILEANGLDFPDAITAGVAAASVKGAVVLTNGSTQSAAATAYFAAHPPTKKYAIGGPAASADPDPATTSVVGTDRYGTAAMVASTFFPTPPFIGVATGTDFPDALAGGALMGKLGGPILLVLASSVPPSTSSYLTSHANDITSGFVFGGTVPVDESVRIAVGQAIDA